MGYEFKLPDLGEGLTEVEWPAGSSWRARRSPRTTRWSRSRRTRRRWRGPFAGRGGRHAHPRTRRGGRPRGHGARRHRRRCGASPSEPDVSTGQTPRSVSQPAGTRARATPLVRKIASELGVDLESVAGTGPQGRITEEDVRAAAGDAGSDEGRQEPLRGVRRVIAEHNGAHTGEVPPVTWVEECDSALSTSIGSSPRS